MDDEVFLAFRRGSFEKQRQQLTAHFVYKVDEKRPKRIDDQECKMATLMNSSSCCTVDDGLVTQQELVKFEAAIQRLLLQDPDQVHVSRLGKKAQQHDVEIDNSGASFLPGVRRRSERHKLREKGEILAALKRLQAASLEQNENEDSKRHSAGANTSELDRVVATSTVLKQHEKVPTLEATTFDVEALVPDSETMEDLAPDDNATEADSKLKLVVACQEIVSSLTFSPQLEIEVALEPKKQETQLVKFRRFIPMVLTLPDDEPSETSFTKQIEIIYNAFRVHNETRTKLKYAVFSWLVKNGTSFYAAATPEERFARRKRGPKWVKKMASLSEQEILEAGLRVVRNRVSKIRKSFKIQNENLTVHFRKTILSWLRKLEIVDKEEISETVILLEDPSNSAEPTKSHQPESFVRRYSTKDIEGSLLLSGLEILNTDSTVRVIGLEDDTDQTDKPDAEESFSQDECSVDATSMVDYIPVSIPMIDELEGCNVMYGTYALFLKMFQPGCNSETNSVENNAKDVLGTKGAIEGAKPMPQLTKCETSLEREVSGVLTLTQPPSTLTHFTSKDDEGDRALINALVELLSTSHDDEPTELIDSLQTKRSQNSVASKQKSNAETSRPLIDVDTSAVFPHNSMVTQSKSNQDGILQETDGHPMYINDSASGRSDDDQAYICEDLSLVESLHEKEIAMVRPVVYKPCSKASDEKLSLTKASASKAPDEAISIGKVPPTSKEAIGLNNDIASENRCVGMIALKKHVEIGEHMDESVDKKIQVLGEDANEMSCIVSAKHKPPKTMAIKGDIASKSKAPMVNKMQQQEEGCTVNNIRGVHQKWPAVTRSTRIERLRKRMTKSIDKDKSLTEEESHNVVLARTLTKQTLTGMLPDIIKKDTKCKDLDCVAGRDPPAVGEQGQKTMKASTSLTDHHEECPSSDTKRIVTKLRVDPSKTYRLPSVRKLSKSKSRGRRPLFSFQPQLSTHYEASTSNDDGSSEGNDGETSGSHEDVIDPCDNDDGENDDASVISQDDIDFPRVRSERCDSFEMMGTAGSTSSSDSDNRATETYFPTDNSVLSSLASLLNSFHGNSHSNDSYEGEEENHEGGERDESVSSCEEDSSGGSGDVSLDGVEEDDEEESEDKNDEDRKPGIEEEEEEEDEDRNADIEEKDEEIPRQRRFKHQHRIVRKRLFETHGKTGKEISEKSIKSRTNGDIGNYTRTTSEKHHVHSGFFLSNSEFDSKHARSLRQLNTIQQQQGEQPLPQNEKAKKEERKTERLSHHRRGGRPCRTASPVMEGDAEIEIRAVLTLDSVGQKIQSERASQTSSPLPLPPPPPRTTIGEDGSPSTNMSRKAWSFLSRRKSLRQNHNHRNLEEQRGDGVADADYHNQSGEDESAEKAADSRDDSESFCNRSNDDRRAGSLRFRRSTFLNETASF